MMMMMMMMIRVSYKFPTHRQSIILHMFCFSSISREKEEKEEGERLVHPF
jgi:hypothetical protein